MSAFPHLILTQYVIVLPTYLSSFFIISRYRGSIQGVRLLIVKFETYHIRALNYKR